TKPIDTPEDMREWVRYAKKKGVKTIGEIGARDPDMMEALLDEANKQGIWTMAHLNQQGVVRMTAIDAAKLGLNEVTHFYGIMESILTNHSVQDWPLDYNYSNNLDRFSHVGRLFEQSAEPGSDQWNEMIQQFVDLDVTFSPTF